MSPSPAEELLVLSYSIAYGLGDPRQPGRRLEPAAVYDRLDAVIETIAASGADVALLQEVDFASRRTYDIDQLQYIAAALGWGFVASSPGSVVISPRRSGRRSVMPDGCGLVRAFLVDTH
jgi:hypothetical protein